MKLRLRTIGSLYILWLMCLGAVYAQGPSRHDFTYTGAAPAGACSNGQANQFDYLTGVEYGCVNSVWTVVNSGGGGAGTVTNVAGSGPSWLTWTVTNPTGSVSISLAPTTAQTTHRVIGTCNAATTFAPCALVAGDLPLIPLSGMSNLAANSIIGNNTGSSATPLALTQAQVATMLSGQSLFTLTTTGTSGAATYSGGTLNIPQYSGGGGTPAGSTCAVQFNSSSSFGGDAVNLCWDNTLKNLGLGSGVLSIGTLTPASIGPDPTTVGLLVASATRPAASLVGANGDNGELFLAQSGGTVASPTDSLNTTETGGFTHCYYHSAAWVCHEFLATRVTNVSTDVVSTSALGPWDMTAAQVAVAGQAPLNNSTAAANTAYVDAAVAAGGIITGLTMNVIPKATSASSIGNSSLSDNGTTISTSENITTTGGFSSGTAPPSVTAGTGGVDAYAEGTVPSVCATSAVDCFYADATQHGFLASFNNGSYLPLPQGPASSTSGYFATWNSTNGGLLASTQFASNAHGGTGIDTSASGGVAQVSSGTWSVSTALANGTTCTTQSAGSNDTKCATNAYVDGKTAYTNSAINTNSSLSASTGSGLYIPGTSLTAGSVYYFASGGLTAAKADNIATGPGVCIAITTTACAYSGVYKFSGTQSWTAGNIIYVSAASAGALVTAAPSTSTNYVQRIGVALANDTILIMPSLDQGTVQ